MTRERRFGFKLAWPRPGEVTVGWAVIERNVQRGHTIQTTSPDPIAELIMQYRAKVAQRGPGEGIELYAYATDADYVGSSGHKDGLTREDHRALIDRAAKRIAANGIPVTISWWRP
ncbi:MAG: hypothetical protein IT537_03305 [Hyphomicrobiales bacterium]|nr:hypothetical protein [Hyphomicrobiales bacterium]